MRKTDLKASWRDAYKQWLCRAGSAKFLYGTFHDRQTGAIVTHPHRQKMGALRPPPSERADIYTKDAVGGSRIRAWNRRRVGMFVSYAEKIKKGIYRCSPLQFAQWEKKNGKGMREIAFPNVYDRTVGAVLLEILEPLLDPHLSLYQHGYRSTTIGSERVDVPGFPKVPRGSTQIVGMRMLQAIRGGRLWVAELDIVNAFPSISRALLKKQLIESGCPKRFATQIIRCLGSKVVIPQGVKNATQAIPGVPLGSPFGPLLFNFFLRSVHIPPNKQVVTASYADNFFIAATTKQNLESELARIQDKLTDLGLTAKVCQKLYLDRCTCQGRYAAVTSAEVGVEPLCRTLDDSWSSSPFVVLKEWMILWDASSLKWRLF